MKHQGESNSRTRARAFDPADIRVVGGLGDPMCIAAYRRLVAAAIVRFDSQPKSRPVPSREISESTTLQVSGFWGPAHCSSYALLV